MIYLSSIDCPIKSQVPLATLTPFGLEDQLNGMLLPKLGATSEFLNGLRQRLAVTLMGAGF